MKVTTINATIKYSQDTGKGAWKAVELGAEATLDAKETWAEAQARLYRQLGCQLKSLWANGNGHKAPEGIESHGETAPPPEPAQNYCQEHQTPFRRYSRGERFWYSHKTADGKWCREK